MTLTITNPVTASDLEAVQQLCWDYRADLAARGDVALQMMTTFYPHDIYEKLVHDLPKLHATPKGVMRMVKLDDRIVGCGMFYAFSPGICEWKRIYLTPAARGSGAATALCIDLIEHSRAAGYHTAYLDTMNTLTAARALYTRVGFTERGPYADYPPETVPHLCFYEYDLTQ